MKNIVFSLFTLLVFTGCGGGGSSDGASGASIHTQIEGDTLTITEEGTLKGLSVKGTDTSTDITQIQFSKVTQEPSREIPSFVTKLSEFFVVEDGIDEEVLLRIPLKNLPKDIDLNHLYLYTLVRTSERINPFWSPVLIDRNLYEKSGDKYIEFKLVGLKNNTYFIGRESSTEEKKTFVQKREEKDIILLNTDLSGIICTPKKYIWKDFSDQTCTFTNTKNETISINVVGFGKGTRWGGVTIEEMISWIMDAQKKLDGMSLKYKKNFIISVHSFSNEKKDWAGYVSDDDNYDTLHLRLDSKFTKETMQHTAVHEFFHHAQAKEKLPFYSNPNSKNNNKSWNKLSWLTEGLADWFSETVYSYKGKATVSALLEVGLDKDAKNYYKNTADNRDRPYSRNYFFKLISNKCSRENFTFKKNLKKFFVESKVGMVGKKNYIFSINTDSSGIKNFKKQLEKLECNFNINILEEEEQSSFESALLYYQYATAWQNDITLLDKNLKKGTITFKKSKSYTNSLDENFKVPPYGVKSYIFKLSKLRQMTITKNINGLKYYLLRKADTGRIVDNADEIMVPSDKDREYFVVFVNDSEKDISGSIKITSTLQNITPIKGSINLPNTAGDLNFVFLSKDTKTAFVLTKDYAEGNLYLYSYDISNPVSIQLLDTELLAGNNIRYVYKGIYLSKDKSKLYTLITDYRHGENIFSIIDISNPFGLNILGTYTSQQNENYFSYNILNDIEGFSEDESKVYFSNYIKEYASSTPQEGVVYLDISNTSNMNLFSGGLNYTLAGHEPQSSVNGVTVSVLDKKLIVEKN